MHAVRLSTQQLHTKNLPRPGMKMECTRNGSQRTPTKANTELGREPKHYSPGRNTNRTDQQTNYSRKQRGSNEMQPTKYERGRPCTNKPQTKMGEMQTQQGTPYGKKKRTQFSLVLYRCGRPKKVPLNRQIRLCHWCISSSLST